MVATAFARQQDDRAAVARPGGRSVAIVGAGPVGLALALQAAVAWPRWRITVFDARSAGPDVAADPRTLALAAGSVQWLRRLSAWPAEAAQPIREVHVSQVPPTWPGAAVRIGAAEQGVDALGAVVSYGALVSALQQRWLATAAAEPHRLASRFGATVSGVAAAGGGVEVACEGGTPEPHDLAVIAEGGVFADQSRKSLRQDYHQTAWVGTATLEGAAPGVAVERFTREGPLALLPLPPGPGGEWRSALVWCVDSTADEVAPLSDAQRITLLNARLPAVAGRVVALSPLRRFALGLNAERTLVQGRQVRIGNAAQTLHPVAGQGLNLGLRDAHALVSALRFEADIDAALRRIEWQRALDRWSMIATTDFLARGFTWQGLGAGWLRGAALAALDAAPPLKRQLARQMMFGWR